MLGLKRIAVLLLLLGESVAAQTIAASLTVAVADENGVAISSARVVVQSQGNVVAHCETDFAGRCKVTVPAAGSYQLQVEREGFYLYRESEVAISGSGAFEVALHHQLEVREQMDVKESTPAIDPAQVASQQTLSGMDVINMPFPETHDYRNVLNFIPGVINDSSQQPHVSGAETYQTLVLLDGFNVTQPANGELLAHISTDAFRQISVEPSRESAEYGKGSAGLLRLETGIGDDHFRVSATNFVPSFQEANGLRFDQFVPRVTFSGPIRKGRAWFFDGVDGELDNNYVEELPKGQNDGYLWRIGNLAKVQTNLTGSDILTASFVVNYLEDEHAFLGPQTLLSATPKDLETSYIAGLKEQHLFSGGALLESGFGYTDYNLHLNPYGTEPYFVNPEIAGGNYYMSADQHAKRWQWLADLNLAPQTWLGKHDVKLGVDVDHIVYDAGYARTPITYLTDGQTLPLTGGVTCLTAPLTANFPCTRYSTFGASPMHTQANDETSLYVQDRWLITDRVLIEPGLRFDEDLIVGKPLYSPRVAGTYVLNNSGNTKFSAGVGTMYDETSIYLAARPFAGTREDTFFSANPDCATNPACSPLVFVSGPVKTTFSANPSRLQAPRFVNWSVALDQKLPWAIYGRAEFIERHGSRGLVYNTVNGSSSGDFVLQNARDDRYDALEITLRRTFRENYNIMGSYTRSRSRSNEVLDFNVDSPILSAQQPGPYPWDSPNRFLSWGYLPFFKLPFLHQTEIAYSMEARTGFPFYVVNDQQQLVEPPGTHRFRDYFSLNLQVEKRFHFMGYYWAVRGGCSDITGHRNPLYVNNNIDSPEFLTYGAFQRRTFTSRIRLLGKKK